jgi:hypothetical protein
LNGTKTILLTGKRAADRPVIEKLLQLREKPPYQYFKLNTLAKQLLHTAADSELKKQEINSQQLSGVDS